MIRPGVSFSQQVLAAVALCLPACGGVAIEDDSEGRASGRDADPDPPPVAPPPVPDIPDPDDPPEVVIPDDAEVIPPPLTACADESDDLLDNLATALSVDYVAIAEGSTKTIVASKHASCEAGMGGAPAEDCGQWRGPLIQPDEYLLDGSRFLIWSHGDHHGSITNQKDLIDFLGVIDTVHEARLVLQASPQGYNAYGCSSAGEGPYCFEYERFTPYVDYVNNTCDSAEGWYDSYCVHTDGTIETLRSTYTIYGQCLGGRRPDGLEGAAPGCANYFALLYRLETAAALAFSQLARELRRLGAPALLVERAEQAAFDECEHSLMAARQARLTGVSARDLGEVVNVIKPLRSLLELALENAEEGLVRESFGAAQAELTARLAPTKALAHFWAKIAQDELRHAELSRDVSRWLFEQLSDNERRQVDKRRKAAVVALERELDAQDVSPEATHIGLPTPRQNKELFSHLRGVLAA